ncbi:MAG TPA: PASTA domain-containing protein [Actinoplanes sp.]
MADTRAADLGATRAADLGLTRPDVGSAAGRADAAWSGRAEVHPRRSGAGDLTPTDWSASDWATPTPDESPGAWWMPIVVGIVVLVLLAVLGVGVWLIVQAGKEDDPAAPAVTPTVAPASTLPTDAATAASPAAPSTEATTAPVDVAIPALVGLSSAEARRALDRVGLTYRLIYRPDEAPLETVIDSDPPEGRQVPADTEVTLVISAPLPTTPTDIPSSPATADDDPGD